MSAAWFQEREAGSRVLLRFMLFLYRSIGRPLCGVLLYPIAAYFLLVKPAARAASLEYLGRVRPEVMGWRRWWWSYRHFLEFARTLVAKVDAWTGAIPFSQVEWIGKDAIRAHTNRGQGVLVLGAHLGNVEVMRALADGLPGLRVTALMLTAANPNFSQVLAEVNPEAQLRVIQTAAVSPDLIVQLQECLERGELVSFLADRVTPGSSHRTVGVPFFGEEAWFPEGPFVLAALLGCPVFLLFCLRTGPNRWRVVCEPFAAPLVLPRRDRSAETRAVVARFASRLEHYCREVPLQWFNFFSVWAQPDEAGGARPRRPAPRTPAPDPHSAGDGPPPRSSGTG